MSANSITSFVPIDKFWGMMEYIYDSDKIPFSESGFMRIKNFNTKEILYFSHPIKMSEWVKVHRLTNNVLDNSCFSSSDTQNSNKIYLDIEKPINLYEDLENAWLFDNVNEILNASTSSLNISYDTLRIHILRGFNFENLNGFVTEIKYTDENRDYLVASNVYLKQDVLKYHIKPLRLADKVYDRYYDIKIPKLLDLKNIHEQTDEILKTEYEVKQLSGILSDTINWELIFSNFEFPEDLSKFNINISIYDIENVVVDEYVREQLNLSVLDIDNDNSIAKISLVDTYSSINASITESEVGDYFEYFASYNGGFIGDWINNNPVYMNSEFVIYHTLALYEQSINNGVIEEQVTQYFTVEQTDNFDEPLIYRPVVLNSDTVSFTIEYYIRMVDINGVIPAQIIRRGLLSYKDAAKYGRNLTKISVNSNLYDHRIVNKIISNNVNGNIQVKQRDRQFDNIKNNTYQNLNVLKSDLLFPISRSSINISGENIILDADGNITNKAGVEILYGQNKFTLDLTPFDNFIIFKISQINNTSVVPYILNKINETIDYKLIVENTDGNKIKIDNINNSNRLNITLKENELLFYIPGDDISKIKSGQFWIIMENYITKSYGDMNVNFKNFENVIYTGNLTIGGK